MFTRKKRSGIRLLASGAIVLLGGAFSLPAPPDRSDLIRVAKFGSNPGNLNMFLYIPPRSFRRPAPLIVALHGCLGSASRYSLAGWNRLARKRKFYVLYPEQKKENHPGLCFNHFLPGEPEKGLGEQLSILEMIARTRRKYRVDPRRIFITGFSSGGQMAGILAATHPRLFAAVSIIGAGSFRCEPGHYGIRGFLLCDPKTGKPLPTRVGGGPYPRMSVWHGEDDKNVPLEKAEEAVDQWVRAHRLRPEKIQSRDLPGGGAYRAYPSGKRIMVESVFIAGMAHVVPVHPPACGSDRDQYYSGEHGYCYAKSALRFFFNQGR